MICEYGILGITAAGSNKSSVPNINPWYLARRGKLEIASATSVAGTDDILLRGNFNDVW